MVWDSYDVYDNRMILLGSCYTAIGQGIWVVGVQDSYSLVVGVTIWMLDVRIYLIPISRLVGDNSSGLLSTIRRPWFMFDIWIL